LELLLVGFFFLLSIAGRKIVGSKKEMMAPPGPLFMSLTRMKGPQASGNDAHGPYRPGGAWLIPHGPE
jgi:hypothetical protein